MHETWRLTWRVGFAPHFTDCELESLRSALLTDDPRLIQGATTHPKPLACNLDWPAEGACGVSYGPWQGSGLWTVRDLEERFSEICYLADEALKEPAACRWFLNWFDDTERGEMRRSLLAEVSRELARRAEKQHPQEAPCSPNFA